MNINNNCFYIEHSKITTLPHKTFLIKEGMVRKKLDKSEAIWTKLTSYTYMSQIILKFS